MAQTAGFPQLLLPEQGSQHFTFGERAVLIFFRGAGGLLGFSSSSGESGLNVLSDRLKSELSDYFWSSRVLESYTGSINNFDEVGSDRGQTFINQFEQIEALGFVGYSAGGLSAIRLAKQQAPEAVDLVVQLDSYEPLTGNSSEDEVLPNNVLKGINYYQNANRLNIFEPDFEPFDLQGARVVEGSENIDAEDFVDDDSITHRNIDDNSALQTAILQNIETFVLQDLQFDRNNQLAISGNTAFINNILSLQPSGPSSSGQAAIATPITIDDDFSFSTRFEFRAIPSGAAFLPGFTWAVWSPDTVVENAPSSFVEIAFNPAVATNGLAANAVAVLAPSVTTSPLAQAIAPLDLDSGEPLTAWVNYNGFTDQLSIFLDEAQTRPDEPLLSYELDLAAIVGPQAQFGFRTTINKTERQAELLTWEFNTLTGAEPSSVIPDAYLNGSLTQQFATTQLGAEMAFPAFTINNLDFATFFDEIFYLRLNPDVLVGVSQGVFDSGYEHFTQFGWQEGRRPSSLYDESFYLATNSDVAQAISSGVFASGLEHFAAFGQIENRAPSAQFNQSDYLAANPDVVEAIAAGGFLSAFEHYVEQGAAEGRDPQRLLFQEGFYQSQNPDVVTAIDAGAFTNGFDHYLSFGCREGRRPSAFFDESQYLTANPDVAAAVVSGELICGWAHYLVSGRFEGRSLQ